MNILILNVINLKLNTYNCGFVLEGECTMSFCDILFFSWV